MIQINEKIDRITEDNKRWREGLNKNMEPVNTKIENEEETSTMLPERNKNNKNKENIKHIEINSKGVKKNQIIKKIKKTKEIGELL